MNSGVVPPLHAGPLVQTPHNGVRPGFWCEVVSTQAACDRLSHRAGAAAIPTAERAVKWIRVSLRALVSAVTPTESAEVDAWLTAGHHLSIRELARGVECVLSATYGETRFLWSARPVLFLPLADREGRELPDCAEEFRPLPDAKGGA